MCHWTGLILGELRQRLNCAGGDIGSGNFRSAEQHLYIAKLELKESSAVIGKSAARRLSKLLDNPHQALKAAQQTIRQGKQGRVSRRRLYPADQALKRVMDRASNKCT